MYAITGTTQYKDAQNAYFVVKGTGTHANLNDRGDL